MCCLPAHVPCCLHTCVLFCVFRFFAAAAYSPSWSERYISSSPKPYLYRAASATPPIPPFIALALPRPLYPLPYRNRKVVKHYEGIGEVAFVMRETDELWIRANRPGLALMLDVFMNAVEFGAFTYRVSHENGVVVRTAPGLDAPAIKVCCAVGRRRPEPFFFLRVFCSCVVLCCAWGAACRLVQFRRCS